MMDVRLSIAASGGTRTVSLADYLDAAGEERAHADAYAWIKGLRNLPVDGLSFRERFNVRGDSLWWFSEIYLHKTRALLDVHRTIAALDSLLDREHPSTVTIVDAPLPVRMVAGHLLARRGIGGVAPVGAEAWDARLRALDLRARRLNFLAGIAPDRFRRAPSRPSPRVAAFIHRAFWKSGVEDGAAETYIGPVLQRLEERIGAAAVQYVGVGPSTHFRAHRLWRPGHGSGAVVPVERYAPRAALGPSRQQWRDRRVHLAALERSAALREHATIGEVDCWPLVREQLAGITWLQWPWSVRSMDEAGAALDALDPDAAVTYAEAGGWGRALVLEARRRGIPTVGLQHGFIYRHWLNYLHEPDEISADDRTGFPRPSKTLLFDEYAAAHLTTSGHFPPGSLEVTGSARLDALVQSVRSLSPETLAETRRRLGVNGHVLLVATKEREARDHLPALLDAASRLPGVDVLIKPHPAEGAEVYRTVAERRGAVRVLDPGEPLGALLGITRAVATVNSTVALDAGVLGVPALSVGLPNNLSPFVEMGAIAGSVHTAELPGLLQRILYDEGFRQQLERRRGEVLGSSAMRSDGQAADRTAQAIEALTSGPARAEKG